MGNRTRKRTREPYLFARENTISIQKIFIKHTRNTVVIGFTPCDQCFCITLLEQFSHINWSSPCLATPVHYSNLWVISGTTQIEINELIARRSVSIKLQDIHESQVRVIHSSSRKVTTKSLR